MAMDIPQSQYSRIEKDVSITEFFKSGIDIDVNMPLLEKIRLIETLDKDERKAIVTFIDIAISRISKDSKVIRF